MSDIAASVLARLKQKSAKTRRSNQLCLQLFCQEEFLRRLQHSRYAAAFTLKGGLLIYSLSGFTGRPTMDIDFLAKGIPAKAEELERIIAEITAIMTSAKYVSFTIAGTKPISATMNYPGISVSLVAHIKRVRVPFKIDVAFGDALFDRTKKLAIPTQLDEFTSPTVQIYPLESVIAEKLDAVLSLMDFSSRMKDYHDIWFLKSQFDFDGEKLCCALTTTFAQRERMFDTKSWENFTCLSNSASMSHKWNLFTRKTTLQVPLFKVVMQEIIVFLQSPFQAVITGQPFTLLWSAKSGTWNPQNRPLILQ